MDPVLGEATTPQGWNRYAYVRNNPLVFVDPNGRAAIASTLGLVGTGGGPFALPPFLGAAGPAAVIVGGGFLGVKVGRALGGLEITEGISVDALITEAILDNFMNAPEVFPLEAGEAFSNVIASISERLSSHALNQMDERGIPPSAVLGAIATGVRTPDLIEGRVQFHVPGGGRSTANPGQATGQQGLSVIVEETTNRVITVIKRGSDFEVPPTKKKAEE